MKRRSILVAASAAVIPLASRAAVPSSERKFTIDLTPGAVGIGAGGFELLELAARHGFESVQPNGSFLASLVVSQRKEIASALKERNLRWGAAGLSVDFRSSEAAFADGMKVLPAQAAALQEAGATRVGTWLKPFHESLTYLANFKQHVARIGEINRVLSDHGLRFGLEYVGTKTLWTKQRHAFIHTMEETKELIAQVNQPSLGLVLDSWHWYTAGETGDDILSLSNQDIVACDLNDAPMGIPVAEQLDNQRELPAATGVIDIKVFLQSLATTGYDGPVRAEPFNQALNQMEDEAAAAATVSAIRKAIELAGF